jgi:polar amino acid transport system substrate-binding protein
MQNIATSHRFVISRTRPVPRIAQAWFDREGGTMLISLCAQVRTLAFSGCAAGLVAGILAACAANAVAAPNSDVPSLWDPKRRPDKPDVRSLRQIRFLTEDDYPPFNFTGASGQLEGFNVDVARAVCTQLAVPCLIQARRWDTIVAALEAGQGDVIAASLAPTPEARSRLLFTDPYYRTPARFVVRRDDALHAASPDAFKGRKVSVAAGSSHEAFLTRFFPGATVLAKPTEREVLDSLRQGEADAAFADGVSLAFWLNGTSSEDCCRFLGGPYLEGRFFGEGIGMALRPSDTGLKKAIDFALFRLWEQGIYADLVRRWFPVSPYAGD